MIKKKTHFEKEELKNQINSAREKLRVIEEREAQELSAPLYRKCFKYKNCYSSPEKPSDYWYLYLKVIAVEGSALTVCEFECDKYGELRYKSKRHMDVASILRYTEISEAEFQTAFNIFQNKMERP